jgi:hypothetical protein
VVDLELDFAGRDVRVHSIGRPSDDLALGSEDELVPHVVCRLRRLRCPLRIDDELTDAGLVAQVDEDETAVVAP